MQAPLTKTLAPQLELGLKFSRPASPYRVYTDGSCWPNPGGVGGWAAIVLVNGRKETFSGCEFNSTNNRMEILAAIKGLEKVPEGAECVVCSDSQYVCNGAMVRHRKWRRVQFRDVKNRDLWERLLPLVASRKCRFEWVRGHSGHELNEECDRLAAQAAQERKSC